MKIEQAEALKVKILERRKYLKSVNIPSIYSKVNLYGGMQSRVGRQADRIFRGKVKKQRINIEKNLNTVDNYLRNLNVYKNRPISEGVISTMSAPIAPNIILPPKPKKGRAVRRNIGTRK